MPRGGGGTFQNVPGTTVSPNTTIQSAWANAFSADVEATFNTEWPLALLPVMSVAKGGTGASTAVGGADALATKGANIASAATTDLSTATGRFVHITGTTTITSFGTSAAGVTRYLVFDGALTLTHNATSLILPGGVNIVTVAGDTATAISEGSGNWRVVDYQKNSAFPTPTAMEFVSSTAVTSVSNIDLINLNTYGAYVIDLINVRPATLQALHLLVSTNNGSSYSASGYAWGYNIFTTASPTWIPLSNGSDSKVIIANAVSGVLADGGLSGTIRFTPNGSGNIKIDYEVVYSSGANLAKLTGFSILGTGVNAIRLQPASGNFGVGGAVRLYGLRG